MNDRLLEQARSWREPLRYWLLACLAGACLLLGARSLRLVAQVEAEEGEPADAPLPEITPAQLIRQMSRAILAYKACHLEATFVDHKNVNEFIEGGKNGPEFVDVPGRFRYATDGKRWRAEFDSTMINRMRTRTYPVPFRWSAGFNGDLHFLWDGILRSGWVLGEEHPTAQTLRPVELFFHEFDSLKETLQAAKTRITGQATVDGYRCYVLQFDSDDPNWHTDWLVSPRQSYLVVRTKRTYRGNVALVHELHELARTPQGAWFPRRIVTQWGRSEHEGKSHFSFDRVTRVSEFERDRAFVDDDFRLDLSYGEPVRDNTTGMAYLNDPWWPEVREVAARFDWPRADLSPLTELQSHVDSDLDGQLAPPLAPAEWAHGEATDLQQLRGKVTLLYFFGGTQIEPTPKQWAALRRLYEVYHPSGLEMIGIATSTSEPRPVAQMARELRLPCPVFVDSAPETKGFGKTFAAYGLKTYTSTVLVDYEGRVHLAKPNALIADLVRLLKEAGAGGVEPMKTDVEYMPLEASRAIEREFHDAVRQGATDGTIRGTVTNAKAGLAQVEIMASLRLRMLSSNWTPRAFALFPYRDRVFQTRTELDGTYELTGLPKGSYELSFIADGKAVVIRDVIVTPDFAPLTADAVLEQDDGLAGTVSDENGEALPGAKIRLTKRHADPSLPEAATIFSGGESTTTDREGRFEFKRLQTGSYSFEITAEGFEKEMAENVLTGSKGLKFTMRRK